MRLEQYIVQVRTAGVDRFSIAEHPTIHGGHGWAGLKWKRRGACLEGAASPSSCDCELIDGWRLRLEDLTHAVAALVVESGTEHESAGGHEQDRIGLGGNRACGRQASLRVGEDVDTVSAGTGDVTVRG